ncbi:hypothetical protein C3432_21985 [Citrobacter amalonaticus]|uniref:HTH lysR-type domain-containing protein n=1 Tax=Citrobacter amalonaticus TaxID=35703 RepID=A0A2S4RS19_CITAM|nr:LysR family transcriptional regulator [Citrobacter amalonaticus]POT55702.1 hypothetical protein C3432_21985 [Citrobacter amalonaticus]POT73915.1 hypothetical protein C3436_19450 [Citrobacter amalonaticus]POU62312.1 hypothetical protein C3430_23385 [Citrobacter amalonaticus]POV02814.1 hypothetical protein C3424_24980 [Citrobacter amalonaticus]
MTIDKKYLFVKYINIFITVADAKSMKVAAKQLGVTPSAVTQNIRQLETLIDCTLFDRQERPLTLTRKGKAFYQQAVDFIININNRMEDLISTIKQDNGCIKLRLLDSLTPIIFPISEKLTDEFDCLSFSTGLSLSGAIALRNYEIDVDININEHYTNDDSIFTLPLMKEHFLIATSKDYQGENKTLEQIANELTFIGYSDNSHIRNQVNKYLKHNNVNINPHCNYDTNGLLFKYMTRGHCWCITTPLCLFEHLDLAHNFSFYPLNHWPPSRTIGVHVRKQESHHVAHVIKRIVTEELKERVYPTLHQTIPWLNEQYFMIID